MPVFGRYKMITGPDGMLALNHVQYIRPIFPHPSFDIFRGDVGDEISKTALSATFAGLRCTHGLFPMVLCSFQQRSLLLAKDIRTGKGRLKNAG